MSRKFHGKVVLVTGASRGIGREVALAFAREGAALVLAARSEEPLGETARLVRDAGAEALAVPTDVASDPAVVALVDAAVARFGRIDVLVNNAGIGRVGPTDAAGFADDVRDTLRASLFGTVAVTRRVLPILRSRGSGSVVNVSSVMGRKAFARFGSYAVVMHAVSAYSDALRQELRGTGIRVTVVHPALTATGLIRDAAVAEMPPPFRHMTPLAPESVARATVRAVYRGQARLVLPRVANLLLLAEALSPRLGDLVARALTVKAVARLLGMSRGRTYHEAIAGAGVPASPAAPAGSAAP